MLPGRPRDLETVAAKANDAEWLDPARAHPVGLEFRIRSLNRGLGHHCVAPEF